MFEELWSSKCSLLLWKKKKKDVISIIIIYWIFLYCENSSWRNRKTQDGSDLFFIDLITSSSANSDAQKDPCLHFQVTFMRQTSAI